MEFLGVATWNPGIRVSRGSLGRSSIDSQRDTPSSAVSCPFHTSGTRLRKTARFGPQKESFTITSWQRDKEGYDEDVKFEAFDRSNVTEFGIALISCK